MAESTRKVLIVEDTVALDENLQVALENMGLQVFHETHGKRAMAIYYAQKPDLLLLDIGLPDTSGWEVLEAIREEQRGKGPVIIIITAYSDPTNRLMGKLQDIDGYLIKPLVPDEVEKIISQALDLQL